MKIVPTTAGSCKSKSKRGSNPVEVPVFAITRNVRPPRTSTSRTISGPSSSVATSEHLELHAPNGELDRLHRQQALDPVQVRPRPSAGPRVPKVKTHDGGPGFVEPGDRDVPGVGRVRVEPLPQAQVHDEAALERDVVELAQPGQLPHRRLPLVAVAVLDD